MTAYKKYGGLITGDIFSYDFFYCIRFFAESPVFFSFRFVFDIMGIVHSLVADYKNRFACFLCFCELFFKPFDLFVGNFRLKAQLTFRSNIGECHKNHSSFSRSAQKTEHYLKLSSKLYGNFIFACRGEYFNIKPKTVGKLCYVVFAV